MGYNVARNPMGTFPNAPIASDLGKKLHPPILSTLSIQGVQVQRERVLKPQYTNIFQK